MALRRAGRQTLARTGTPGLSAHRRLLADNVDEANAGRRRVHSLARARLTRARWRDGAVVNVQASAETLATLGCKGVERLVIERSASVEACPWPALIASATLPALGSVRVAEIDRDGVFDPSVVWPAVQRDELAQACQARRIGFSAFWAD